MLRILAVDDDPKIRSVLEQVLAGAGYRVFLAASGTDAIDMVCEQNFDVAVVDYQIPGPNGIEVLAAIHALSPACINILQSGVLDVPAVTQAVNRGYIAKVMLKPFLPEDLLQAIKESLAERQQQTDNVLALLGHKEKQELASIEECFDKNLFRLAMQPIVTANTRQVFGYECLLRVNHTLLSGPLDVLRIAEQHNQISRLSTMCMLLAEGGIRQIGESDLLFVNLHPIELADPESLLKRMCPLLPFAKRVVIELTERSKITDIEAWEVSLAALGEAGFRLAVDDVGAGYSSLSALAYVKPQFMKIDMSLVRGIEFDEHKRNIIELICQLGKVTNAQVLAEGIERESEAKIVEEIGVDLMQGFLFGRPV